VGRPRWRDTTAVRSGAGRSTRSGQLGAVKKSSRALAPAGCWLLLLLLLLLLLRLVWLFSLSL
jgi:hypothetical protein